MVTTVNMQFCFLIILLLGVTFGLLLENQQNPNNINAPVVQYFPKDCLELYLRGHRMSGLYTIYPEGGGPLQVYCDQTTDGGGWTVFQRRTDGIVDFFRNYVDYKYGFGNKSDEHWLGNHRIYELTRQGFYELRIDMSDFSGNNRYAVYKRFSIGDEKSGYALHVEDYNGTAGDSLSHHSGAQFYTKDHDTSNNCAATYKGGWWYVNCHISNLNGMYLRGTHTSYADGINWNTWHGFYYSLKTTEMKTRRL